MTRKERQTALNGLSKAAPVDRIIWPDDEDSPSYIYGRLLTSGQDKPENLVRTFFKKHGTIYGVRSQSEYRVAKVKQDTLGNRNIWVERLYRGLRVYPSGCTFWVDPSGVLKRVQAKWPELPKISAVKPKITASDAVKSIAKTGRKVKLVGAVRDPKLEYHVTTRRGRSTVALVWNFVARFTGEAPNTEGFIVNATTGKLVRRYDDEDEVATTTTGIGINNVDETDATPARTLHVDNPGGGANLTLLDTSRSVDIETYDMAGATDLTAAYSLCADDDGDGVFENITNTPRHDSDRPEVGAHYNTGLMHDYLERTVTVNGISLFGRSGWNNDPATKWISKVHRSTDSVSSFFSRSAEVTGHGDGDGTNMTYKSTLDTCSHEWGHAVQYSEIPGGVNTGGFDSTPGENFVLQEATADMFAGVVNLEWGWHFAHAFEDDASLAAGTHSSTGFRLRGFQNPSAYTQPDHYQANADTLGQGFAGTAQDYTRTGILDKAAYLMASGGTHPTAASDPATYPPVTVYGIGVTCFQNIFYYALTQLTAADDVFSNFRQNMIDAAEALYPSSPCKAQSVARAFDAVGIYESGGTTPPPPDSGPNPMITPWGITLDTTPYWQSPDIYVKDAADAIADPLKGQVNRLFANVSNIGDADATGVTVEFDFRPYGMGTSNNAWKTIATETVDIPTGTSLEVEVAWDLSDLTDTNGGQWPLPLGDFDHFCVRVQLDHVDDVDACNNLAQNNFGNVEEAAADDGDGIFNFVLGNFKDQAEWVVLVPHHTIPDNWIAELDTTNAFRGNTKAVHELVKRKAVEAPWVGDARGAIMVPLAAGETRALSLKWKTGARKKYDGIVQGVTHGTVKGAANVSGNLVADVRHLTLKGRRFSARIIGRIKTRSGHTAIRGVLSGEIEAKTGKYKATFAGIISMRKTKAQRAKFEVSGTMGASALFSFAAINGDDQQGIDLQVRIIGEPDKVRRKLRGKTVPGKPVRGG